jgi:hypothetical protein
MRSICIRILLTAAVGLSAINVQPQRPLGIRPRSQQEAQRNRAALPAAQRLPQSLLPLRETHVLFLGFLTFAFIIEALR